MRKSNTKIIAGNWKMNLTVSQAVQLTKEIIAKNPTITKSKVILSPHFLALKSIIDVLQSSVSSIQLAAQDVHWEEMGAYTGKIATSMLSDLGLSFVIVGHSEQRTYFHETNQTVNLKILKLLEHQIIPIICIGESLAERESGRLEEILKEQVIGAYQKVTAEQALQTIIAYEPVWAIGTGVTASTAQAQEAHLFVRNLLQDHFSESTSQKIPILYGGSMNPKNAQALLEQSDIDGGLIGGSSLKADNFSEIITIAENLA